MFANLAAVKKMFACRALVAAVAVFATALALRAADDVPAASCRPDFIAAATYPFSQSLSQLLVADLDGDGYPDLVTASYSYYGISVRLGRPDGTFAPEIDQAPNVPNGGGVIGTFDANATPDLILETYDGLTFFAGNGDGTFQPGVLVNDTNLYGLTAADLNGDGKLDLVGMGNPAVSLVVLLGNGDGSFQAPIATPMKTGANELTVGDVDGDGKADVVTAGSTLLVIYPGIGNGRFGTPRSITGGSTLSEPNLADLNGDGAMDIVASDGAYVAVLLGNGDGTFQAAVDYPAFATRLALGDFDGDGHPDVAALGGDSVTVLLGPGDGTLVPGPSYAAGFNFFQLVAADFGADGVLDLAAAGGYPNSIVAVFRGNGDGTFRAAPVTRVGFNAAASAMADLDGDGLPDLVLANQSSITVFRNAGAGNFSEGSTIDLDGVYVTAVVAGDFDEDGRTDVAVVVSYAPGLRLLLGNGDGTFQPPIPISVPPPGFAFQQLAAADFDGDGHLDLALTYQSTSNVGALAVFAGHGDGTFGDPMLSGLPSPTYFPMLVADLNEDGRPDLALLEGNGSGAIDVLLGNGDGTFQVQTMDSILGAESLAAGDLRQTGHLDLLLGSSSGVLALFPGNGQGAFGAPALIGVGDSAAAIAVADFDGDGLADVATGSGSAIVLFGAGGGAFDAPRPFATSSFTTVYAGDFDGNGTVDAAFVWYEISVLRNARLGGQVRSGSALVGSAAVLRVDAGGFGPLSYQWRRNGTPLSDGGAVSGSTTATLTIDPVSFADAASYDVLLTDSCGTVASSPGSLSVEFADVPASSLFHDDIITIATAGITSGCGGSNYCPTSPVRRDQMAVFLLKSEHGSAYAPPACSGVFADVACPSLFADWVEQLSAEGVTSGCGGGDYCPASSVTRAQMAVFLLKTKNGSAYVPPPAAGIFGDVPVGSFAADFIEALYNASISGGCQASPLLFCPGSSVSRQQMAPLLVRTFGLGP